MLKKILTTLFGLIIGAGFLYIYGVAGSSDLNLIDFKTILIHSAIGLAIMGGGFIGLKIIDCIDFN